MIRPAPSWDSRLSSSSSVRRPPRTVAETSRHLSMNVTHPTLGTDARFRAKTDTTGLLPRIEELTLEAARLKTLAVAFERWHQDMIGMTVQNRNMSAKGEDLANAARQLIMVSLNAAIEAARA